MTTIGDQCSQIEKLPKEVVSQILSCLHPKQLKICASLNRFFYKLVVSLETTSCIVLSTRSDIIKKCEEIIQTTRTIHNIRVGSELTVKIFCTRDCWNALFAIFFRHGQNLQKISFGNIQIAREDLLDLIGCCTQYVSLDLRWISSSFEAQNLMDCRYVNKCVKEVTVRYCDEPIQSIINLMAANTVSSIDFVCSSNAHLKPFFNMQKNLKKVSVRFYNEKVNFSCLQFKKIESLAFGSYRNQSSLVSLLVTQIENLQHLDLSCARIDNFVFTAASGCSGLRSLKVSLNNVSMAAFQHIRKLHQLEELTLIKNDRQPEVHLAALAKCSGMKLRKLELLYPITAIRTSVYIALVSNLKLKDFYISSIISPKSLQEVINNCNSSFRTLKVQDSHRLTRSLLEIAETDNFYIVNLNLRELSMQVDSLFIAIAVNVFPKLQKLEFETSCISYEIYKLIFTKLKDLSELRVNNKVVVNLQELFMITLLLQHGPRFKFISLLATKVPEEILQSIYGRTFVEVKQDHSVTEFCN